MKHLATITAIMILLMASQGCRHRAERLEPYGWTLIDPKFDSLTRLAEQYMYTNVPLDSVEHVTRQMDSIARSSNRDDNEMLARKNYWEAYRLYMSFENDKANKLIDSTDSLTSEKYTKERLKTLKMTFGDFTSYDTFLSQLRQREYYISIGDMPAQGEIANNISTSLKYAQNIELALDYLSMADSLYRGSGNMLRADYLRINKATLLYHANRMEEADALFRDLLSDSTIINDKAVLEVVLYNYYDGFGDAASLFGAYNIRKDIEVESLESKTLTAFFETRICEYYLNRGMIDSATYYFEKRRLNTESIRDEDIKYNIFKIDANYYETIGEKDKALTAIRRYNEIQKTMAENQQSQNKIYADFMNAKRHLETEAAATKASLTRRIWIISGISISVLLAGLAIGIKWYRRYKIKHQEITRRADKREREIMGIALSRQHSEQLLDYVDKEISRLSRQEIISEKDLSQLDKNLRLHKFDGKMIQNFEETFAKIHPDFDAKLRSIAPTLSDTQIRLCAYIVLGLNNQEIASILNIKPNSLRQARLRLRQKFGLTKDDSITDFLRAITPPKCLIINYLTA